MKKISVSLADRSYPIYIGDNILAGLAELLMPWGKSGAIITDETVKDLWGNRLQEQLTRAGYNLPVYAIVPGEESKSLSAADKIYQQLLNWGLDRKSFLIACGGGVVGDLAGFVAATYMRGINYFQVPTTLMAQVDSSIGGKTAVNLSQGKNLVGSFWQPRFVYIDIQTLSTLPQKEMRTGLAEVVKYGVIRDRRLFNVVAEQQNRLFKLEKDLWLDIIITCARIKAEVVGKDERELSGLRAILNYGHTIGHALETLTDYQKLTHGEAVAIGMAAAAKLACRLGYLNAALRDRQIDLLRALGLPARLEITSQEDRFYDRVLAVLRHDKKAVAGKLRFVLAEKIGKVIVTDKVPEAEVRAVLEEVIF